MIISNKLNRASTVSWFTRPRPNPRARLRLFCFPYAGGGPNTFYSWPSNLPPEVEVCPLNLPGRGSRIKEAPFERMPSLIQAVSRALLPYADKPFAFFGHSMGGLMSFELCRHLRRQYGLGPVGLFVSACLAPQNIDTIPRIRELPDREFLNELRRLNGTPGEMLGNAQLMNMVVPTLRADFAICETYVYEAEPPLECSINAYGGLQDHGIGREHLENWRYHTEADFKLHMLSGDHFFIHTEQAALLELLSQELTDLLEMT